MERERGMGMKREEVRVKREEVRVKREEAMESERLRRLQVTGYW